MNYGIKDRDELLLKAKMNCKEQLRMTEEKAFQGPPFYHCLITVTEHKECEKS